MSIQAFRLDLRRKMQDDLGIIASRSASDYLEAEGLSDNADIFISPDGAYRRMAALDLAALDLIGSGTASDMAADLVTDMNQPDIDLHNALLSDDAIPLPGKGDLLSELSHEGLLSEYMTRVVGAIRRLISDADLTPEEEQAFLQDVKHAPEVFLAVSAAFEKREQETEPAIKSMDADADSEAGKAIDEDEYERLMNKQSHYMSTKNILKNTALLLEPLIAKLPNERHP